MNRSRYPLAAILAACAAFAACAPRTAPPVERIYVDLQERPETFHAGVLAGKRIVIDPGHGGAFAGVLGPDSLREADANLGVALYLWGLCADAGADVHLTRTTDRDRLPEGSTEAGDDLRARVAAANDLEPDVFLSIHHNSNIALDRSRNAIEVYYRSSDTGPSLELAQTLQVHLSRNLGIAAAEVKPGGYLVLRSSTAHAAVLGEASYLSHPLVENRLRFAEKQKLEAQAYFFGLISYFSRGVPSIARLSPAADTVRAPAEIAFAVRSRDGVPLDPSSARVRIGDADLVAVFDPDSSVIRRPMNEALPNGPYEVRGAVRSARGATARSKPFTVLLSRPARHVIPLVPRPDPGGGVVLSLRVLDELGLPVADGTPVSMIARRGNGALDGASRDGVVSFPLPDHAVGDAFVVSAGAVSDTIVFPRSEAAERFPVRVVDARTGTRVPFPVAAGRTPPSAAGDANGLVLLSPSMTAETLRVAARGYRPAVVDGGALASGAPPHRDRTVALEPVLDGALAGRRVAIDPGGGGADAGGLGRRGLRGASVNLAVARRLAELLEEAGAVVALTREGEETLSAQERVYLVNRSGAELAIGIRSGARPSGLDGGRLALHHPGSARGALAAETLAASLAALPPGGAFAVGEWTSPFLQQTACPAVELYVGAVEEEASERIMGDDAWVRLAASLALDAAARRFAAGP
jgi:N-acetylmuramoyl-L-alanine amidase